VPVALLARSGRWSGRAGTVGRAAGNRLSVANRRGRSPSCLQCEYYALEGLSQLLNTVHLVQRSVNEALAIDGVLLTMYDARLNLSRQVAAEAREYFGAKVFETVIPRNVRLAEAPSFGKPIILYDVASVGAQAYMNVARELIERSSMWREQSAQPFTDGVALPDSHSERTA